MKKMTGGPTTLNIKIALLFAATLMAVGTLYYTQALVQKLQEKERQIVQLYAQGIEYIANSSEPDVDITFLFDNIIKPIDFPMIQTDAEDDINFDSHSDIKNIRNIEYDTTLSSAELEMFFKEKVREMDETHLPIIVT